MRSALRDSTIRHCLSNERIYQYQVPWHSEGVKPEKYSAHEGYLRRFCDDFTNAVISQINLAKHRLNNQIPTREYYSNYDEILHHLYFCKAKVEHFCGQDDVLQQVRQYLLEAKQRAPLVLYADSGAGKTSLMAKIFTLLPQWFGADMFRCIRFLGTSPYTSNIYDVLYTVVGQLADNYDHLLEPMGYKSMRALVKYFPRYIRNISRITKQHVFIMLDSIDQLSKMNGAYGMKWLMTDLPSNVHIIISMLPNTHEILDNTRALGLKPSSFIAVKALKESTGVQIIDEYFRSKHRTLTPAQMALVVNSIRHVPNPLYLKLLLDRAVTWKSYTHMDDVIIPNSVRSAITHLFETLEGKSGRVLIAHTLGYLTVGLNGLSEVEVEDVLSCDDAVLDEVYQYHNPPVEGIIRVPSVLLSRIHFELQQYLTERLSQGKTTLYWYHRQFIEAAMERYVQPQHRMLHQALANYYMAEHGVQKDITLTKRKLTIPDADRQVTANPLTARNVRVLVTLPYHLRLEWSIYAWSA